MKITSCRAAFRQFGRLFGNFKIHSIEKTSSNNLSPHPKKNPPIIYHSGRGIPDFLEKSPTKIARTILFLLEPVYPKNSLCGARLNKTTLLAFQTTQIVLMMSLGHQSV